jgi:exodeoxyribonuclease V beta subunit
LKPLDLTNTPLEGINLIEASAGTGKTYTIEGLFLRLILEKQFRVDQILVVTFTIAATEELRDRIRTKLLQAEKAFNTGTSKDNLLMDLLKSQTDHRAAVDLIHTALVEFDKASIFTIHGFCARILFEHAFETGNLFDTELVSDQTELIREVAEDYWRINFYNAPLEFISFFTKKIKGPGYFWQLMRKIRAAEMNIVPQISKPPLNRLPAFHQAFQQLKTQWPEARDAVIQALQDPALSGTPYGSLKPAKNAVGMTKRDIKIRSMVAAMEKYAAPSSTGIPLFKSFENFTAQKLSRAARKNQSAPSHEFFVTCDDVYRHAAELEAELENYFIYLKSRLFAYASSELRERKSQKNIQFFDDLLVLVKQALAAQKGNPLAEAIRQRYKAALVDEFQDTDSVQYAIFSRLFAAKDSLLFMIGDPKQAIYSFRGADIFSYIQAARHAQAKFTLTDNWRSEPLLITAVNTIFSNVKIPFLFEEIPFEDARPGNKRSSASKESKVPLRMWYLDSRVHSDQDKPIGKAEAEGLIAGALSEEICRIVNAESEPWFPEDMAVLVRTNRQALLVKERLSAKGLPSVLYSTVNIFDSREAMEVEKILTGISEPDNLELLKGALAMEMMGAKGEDLLSVHRDTRQWENWLTAFREYFQVWQQFGFIRMFRMVLAREKIRQRLLSFPDGERRLTNVLHLAEIIHQESAQRNLGIAGLLKWLAEQRDPQSPRLEEHQLRLESDAGAVKIVTIHKSKGLEYPVVFCPYGWEGSFVKDPEIIFHQADDDQSLTLDLGSDARDLNVIAAQNELLAENIRLLYVALTRAKSICYLVWGRINTAETSALAYLLHSCDPPWIDYRSVDLVADLKRQVGVKSDEDHMADLNRLVKKSQGSIAVVSWPELSERNFFEQPQTAEPLACRKFTGKIDRTWKVSSYSSLLSRRISDIDLPDRDAFSDLFRHLADAPQKWITPREPDERNDIFAFPKGSRAGNFFHDLFEHLDYTTCSARDLSKPVQNSLQAYGFDRTWQHIISDTISHVLKVPLQPTKPDLTLSSIAFKQRINEMEFYFPLKTIRPQTLRSLFRQHGSIDNSGDFSGRLEKLVFSPAAGFMKGYMDLVFQHQDQFYLVDWKSNYLGPTIDDYRRDALQHTMQKNYYVLQYHLYVLALCQYLRLRRSGFRYESDFGGVFYIFIRGIDSRRNPEFGIFYDLPKPALVNALGNALIPGFLKV